VLPAHAVALGVAVLPAARHRALGVVDRALLVGRRLRSLLGDLLRRCLRRPSRLPARLRLRRPPRLPSRLRLRRTSGLPARRRWRDALHGEQLLERGVLHGDDDRLGEGVRGVLDDGLEIGHVVLLLVRIVVAIQCLLVLESHCRESLCV